MRHSSRQRHLKHLHRSAHIRRMCYFRTVQCEDACNADKSLTQTLAPQKNSSESPSGEEKIAK
ncbi:hypothetical protein [Shewanella woodyi]|uniref:hypothetical protein n=1 Tax=Shewanella woodyi TaxID=60961 RepID=UPI0012F85C83|nr:hypothetical protein [Shewanella woodyi]